MTEAQIDLAPLEKLLDKFKDQKGAIIPLLQRAQSWGRIGDGGL